MTHSQNPYFCISEFHIPKALFCSNNNTVTHIYIAFQLAIWLDSKKSNTVALYAFLCMMIKTRCI